MNEELKKRIKSFSWRLGGMCVASVLAFIIDNATLFEIPTYMVILLGLLAGEISKYLNK